MFMMAVWICFILAVFLSLTCDRYTERLYVYLIKCGVLLPDERIDSDWVVIKRMGGEQRDTNVTEGLLGQTVSGERRKKD